MKGFIFTLDAFIALSLAFVLVSVLIFYFQIPSVGYERYEQIYNTGEDALTTLENLRIGDFENNSDYPIASYACSTTPNKNASVLQEIIRYWKKGNALAENLSEEFLEAMIPSQYGFNLIVYNTTSEKWESVYARNKKYTTVQVVAVHMVSEYKSYPNPGESPFCYITCKGYDPSESGGYHIPCNITPSEPLPSMFEIGEFLGPTSVKLIIWI